MKVEDLKLNENALLAIDLLRNLVDKIEKPDMVYDGSVEELVKLLDIAAHSSSTDIVQCAQQLLGFTSSTQNLFFRSVGVRLENIFSARMLADAEDGSTRDAFSDSWGGTASSYKWM